MKITEIESLPVAAGAGTYLLIAVHTADGAHGLGEVGMRSRPGTVLGALRDLADIVIGQDANRIEHVWQTMYRGGFFPADRDAGAAMAAIDMALWDLRGKTLGVPLYELLGGPCRDQVPAYVHLRGTDVEAYVDNARRLVELGWSHLRFSLDGRTDPIFEPRQAVRDTLGVLGALRDALGDGVELLIDVHTRLDPADAVTFCREAEPFRPYFVEDPLRSEDPGLYRTLRERTGVPLAAGEQYTTKWAFRPLLEGDLIDHARIDLANTGITEGRKIAAMAEAHHIQVATHNPLGPVCSAASAHLNTALPNVSVQEQLRPHGWDDDPLVEVGPVIAAGSVRPADLAGLGVQIDLDYARKNSAADRLGPPPQYRRADGSFTNW
ncbi:mandelate racemase/muconate lactonizing enzyme family protein [Phytoactinopolyspora halotolerans]|uniref:Mandelate racemase/muconate lactonizing enzyme family protein n=1 Tax=Phytoactinopolyspora halotolerans TaxID=1981512 RepID=A0A6L9SDC0_9ACTN|nr:mandelate racemase/muconate lactonizing enzyme family protein [Phytoactinopolyspora halotolerans]NEE02562.1 mandelate racemase/muconate lactonizing enzyme family protein [Phytoactinopolyspora halotolerans]